MNELRERIKLELIARCPFVDKCERQCTPTDQEDCYGQHADAIIPWVVDWLGERLLPASGLLTYSHDGYFLTEKDWESLKSSAEVT